jgi:hypothetical protein
MVDDFSSPRQRSTPIEAIFTLLFILVAAVSWAALLLAEFGAFSGRRVLLCAAIIAATVGFAGRRDLKSAFATGAAVTPWVWISLAVTLACSAILVSRPGECLIDGRDASVYVAIGRTIEHTGGIVSSDPLRGIVGADALVPLLARDLLWPHELTRFPGGIQAPEGNDRLVPLFHPLLPAWIATVSSLTGPRGGYFVNAIFGLLGVFALWLVGRRAWSPIAGGVAAALLAINGGQILYSRLALSEVPAQYLMLAGVFFTLQAWDTRSRLAGGCAGAAIGLAGFTRIDALIVLVPLTAVFLAYAHRRNLLGPAWRWSAAMLAIVGAHAAAHALLVSRPYTLRVAGAAWDGVSGRLGSGAAGPVLVLAAAAGVTMLALAARRSARWSTPAARSLALVVGAGVTLALLASPAIGMAGRLLSPPGVAAALAGLAVVMWRGPRPRVFLVVAPFVADAVLLGTWPEAAGLSADFRRLVPSMLPIAMLFIGVLVSDASTLPSRALRIAWALPAGLAALWLWQAWPMLRTPPLQDLHRRVALVASRLPSDAVVLSDWSVPSHLMLALQSGFGRICLPLVERPPSASSIGTFIDRVLASGRPVFVMIGGYEGEIGRRLWRSDVEGFEVRDAGLASLRYTMAAPLFSGFPRPVPTISRRVELYQVSRPVEKPRIDLPLAIEVGDLDFRWLLRGFYGREWIQDVSARWTSGHAEIALPRLAAGDSSVTLLLRIATHRPPGAAAPIVRLSIDGTPAGSIERPGQEFKIYQIALDPRIAARLRAGPATLTIASDTIVPGAGGGVGDVRALGVVVDWLRLE